MKAIIYLTGLIFLCNSCIKNNPDPSWLEVNPWVLESNSNSAYPTGELTQNFSDVKVVIDEKVIGIFEAPFKIPLLLEGEKVVRLYPTVKNNGISATKAVYPFVEPYEMTVNFEKSKTSVINPTTRYYASVKFWIEDFEDATNAIDDDPNFPASIQNGTDPGIKQSFNGNFYGSINLDASKSRWVGATNQQIALPLGQVYLEIDYHNTNSLITGLIAHTSVGNVNNVNIQLNAQDPTSVSWKKIYIDLKELVVGSSSADSFDLSFDAILDEGSESGQINIDNIKLVHF